MAIRLVWNAMVRIAFLGVNLYLPQAQHHKTGLLSLHPYLHRLMNAGQKSQLVGNLVTALKSIPRFIQVRQMGHFYKADPDYGVRVGAGLGIDINEIIGKAA